MKKTLILAFVLLSVSVLHAQNIVVNSFRELPNDLDARVNFPRTDQNGKKCAILKVTGKNGLKLDDGLRFEVGSLGIIDIVKKTGEYWVYVPTPIRKISVYHDAFGIVRDHNLGIPVREAVCYELVLGLEGKEVTLVAAVNGSTVLLDNDTVGVSPARAFVPYGSHMVKAANGHMKGETNIEVSPEGAVRFDIPMEDETKWNGKVTLLVDGNAEIFFDGTLRAIGQWTTDLRAGTYLVETRKENCESKTTSITVVAQQEQTFQLYPPEPYHGFLQVNTTPADVRVSCGERSAGSGEKLQLELGNQTVTFSSDGYITREKTYWIERDQVVTDEIKLDKFMYVKRNTFYAGAAFSYYGLMGATAVVGGVLRDIDLQLSYSIGLTASEELHWYSTADHIYQESCQYKMDVIGAKIGYQIKLSSHIGLTPQAGYTLQTLKSSGQRGNGAACGSLALGAKFTLAPFNHFYLTVAPEYALPMQKSDTFTRIASLSSFSEGGVSVHVAMMFNI